MARILVVDDEAAILSALRQVLARSGHDVATAASGPEALEKLVPFAPDIVLSDLRMPGMNGAELHTQVRRRWPFALRIILSGFADLASMASAINEGEVCRFISKPWDGPQLVETLERLLGERAQVSQLIGGLQAPRALNICRTIALCRACCASPLHTALGGGRSAKPAAIVRHAFSPEQVCSHARSIEVRMDLGPQPLSADRAVALIAQLTGLAQTDPHELVSGLLEKRGGKLTFSAEIGGPRPLSIDVPVDLDAAHDAAVAP